MADETGMTVDELLDAATGIIERPDAATTGCWPRAAALLVRQALEQSLGDAYAARGVEMREASTRAQLLCLSRLTNDRDAIGDAAYLWGALSVACHHHPFELAPTLDEVQRLHAGTRRLATRLAASA